MVSCFLLYRRLRQGVVSQESSCSLQNCLAVAHSRCELDSGLCQARCCLEQDVAKHSPDKTSGKNEELLLWGLGLGCISFLFYAGFEQLHRLGYARATGFRPFGALDPSNIVISIEARQGIEEILGFWLGGKRAGDIRRQTFGLRTLRGENHVYFC